MAGAAIRSILVVATRQIGDVLLTVPLIERARVIWPQARIDVLGFGGTLGMLAGHPAIGTRIEVPAGEGWRASLARARALWKQYDLALITQQSDRAHLYGLVAARRRSGIVPARTSIAWWKRRALAHAVTVDDETTPTVLEKLALLAPWDPGAAGITVTPPAPKPLPPDVLQALEPAPVVVHAPSMWRYKQWPTTHFAQLVRALLAAGHQVVLTGTASATDQAQIGPLRGLGAAPALLDLSGRLDLGQTTTLLRRAALYVGPDTSITHLAAACGVPMVTVFGPTNPIRWGPWPQGHAPTPPWQRKAPSQRAGVIEIVQAAQDCVACGRAGCDDHRDSRSACLEAIAPERVIAACLDALARAAAPHPSTAAPSDTPCPH